MGKIIEIIGDGNYDKKNCCLFKSSKREELSRAVDIAFIWATEYLSRENGGELTFIIKEEKDEV